MEALPWAILPSAISIWFVWCIRERTIAAVCLVDASGDGEVRVVKCLGRVCCVLDGGTSGEGATMAPAAGAWFCGDVLQPAKTETTSAATSTSRLPKPFRDVAIAFS